LGNSKVKRYTLHETPLFQKHFPTLKLKALEDILPNLENIEESGCGRRNGSSMELHQSTF
jgi:hypothetical protein